MVKHEWREIAAQLRVDSIRATTAAGSGHPTSSLSAADPTAVLLESEPLSRKGTAPETE